MDKEGEKNYYYEDVENIIRKFERNAIPERKMPDSPEMEDPRYDDVMGVWMQITSAYGGFIEGHHSWEELKILLVKAYVFSLTRLPPNHEEVLKFRETYGITPEDFLERFPY